MGVSGLGAALNEALRPWRKPVARHDPAKVVTELAVSLAVGGDACRDASLLRVEPGVYGAVASDATISLTTAALAGDIERGERAVAQARMAARSHVWRLAGRYAPNHGASAAKPLVIDLVAALVTAHSDEEHAAATYKRGYGFSSTAWLRHYRSGSYPHPLCAFVDHGADGTGEPLAMLLRPGNAGSNTATDHERVIKAAWAATPGINPSRPGKKIVIRTDGAGCTRELLAFLHRRGVSYSIGWPLPATTPELYRLVPEDVWQSAHNADGAVREGAHVAEFTDLLTLKSYPPGMRVIVRCERPHPGDQLRFEDVDGFWLTAPPSRPERGPHTHRQRHRPDEPAPAGLRPQPPVAAHRADYERPPRVDGPTRPGRALARTGRQRLLHVRNTAPWAGLFTSTWKTLNALSLP